MMHHLSPAEYQLQLHPLTLSHGKWHIGETIQQIQTETFGLEQRVFKYLFW